MGVESTSEPGSTPPRVDGTLVSVIIPTLNSERTLPKAIASVRAQEGVQTEILIVDGGSTDRTVSIATEAGCRLIVGRMKRSSARALGADGAHGNYFLFLDSDQEATPGLIEECVDQCRKHGAAAVRIPERDEANGFWTRCWALDRKLARSEALSYPRFFERGVYVRAGGHSTVLEEFMEDRDLLLRVLELHASVQPSRRPIVNSPREGNPLLLSRSLSQTATDAQLYYRRNRARGEQVAKLVGLRARAFLSNAREMRTDLPAATCLPLYYTVVFGPRLLRTGISTWGRGRPTS
jgi:glycosyltransferase involved in cell wall biosynthesis